MASRFKAHRRGIVTACLAVAALCIALPSGFAQPVGRRPELVLQTGHGIINRLAVSPDSKTLATAGYNCSTIKLWDVQTGDLKRTLQSPDGTSTLAFSPNARFLAADGRHSHVLQLWNVPQAVTDPDPAAAKRAFDAMMEMKKIDIAAIEAARRG